MAGIVLGATATLPGATVGLDVFEWPEELAELLIERGAELSSLGHLQLRVGADYLEAGPYEYVGPRKIVLFNFAARFPERARALASEGDVAKLSAGEVVG